MKKSPASILFLSLIVLSFSAPLSAKKTRCHPDDQKAVEEIKTALGMNPKGDCCAKNDPISECGSDPSNRVIRLAIFYSNFSGQIPPAVGDLPYLFSLIFNYVPNLTGSIPPSVAKLSNLVILILSHNGLSGPLPTFLPMLKNLSILDLSFNSFTGSIPPEFSQFESINDLSLSHNRLSGKIPNSLGKLNPGTIDLSYNNFVGDASFLLGENKTLSYLYLSRNRFSFDFSKLEFPAGLYFLEVEHNEIFGSIPQQLTQLGSNFFLNVSYNRLCGEIPQGGLLQQFDIYSYIHNKCLCGAPLPPCK